MIRLRSFVRLLGLCALLAPGVWTFYGKRKLRRPSDVEDWVKWVLEGVA